MLAIVRLFFSFLLAFLWAVYRVRSSAIAMSSFKRILSPLNENFIHSRMNWGFMTNRVPALSRDRKRLRLVINTQMCAHLKCDPRPKIVKWIKGCYSRFFFLSFFNIKSSLLRQSEDFDFKMTYFEQNFGSQGFGRLKLSQTSCF